MSKEIKTVIYPEQEKAYYDALEKGDMYVANLYFRPPIYIPIEIVKSQMKINDLIANFEAEKKRIRETPNEILRLEIEQRLGIKSKRPKKENRRTFFQRLFGI